MMADQGRSGAGRARQRSELGEQATREMVARLAKKFQAEEDKKTTPPLLTLAVRKFMCIPASEAPCERIFSILGNCVSKRRGRLTPHHVALLMFLHSNQSLFASLK